MSVNLTPDDDDLVLVGELTSWVIPFSIPATVTAADVSRGPMVIKGVGFKNVGWQQFTTLGEQNYQYTGIGYEIMATGPDRNLCGSLSYLDYENTYKGFYGTGGEFDYASKQTSTTIGSHTHGLRIPAGQTYQVYDILTRLSYGGSSTTGPVSLFYVPDSFGFTESGFGVYDTLDVDSEATATYYAKWDGYGPAAKKESYGSWRKSNPVTRDWLAQVAAGWLALSLALKKETTSHFPTPSPGLGWIAPGGATLTDSTDGYQAGASAISAWTELDLSGTEASEPGGIIYKQGWTAPFQVIVPTETRKNFPVLRDTEHHAVSGGNAVWTGPAIFNHGEATIELEEEISGRKWRDSAGLFAPGEEQTLDQIGWGLQLDSTDNSEPDVSVQSAAIQLLSCDGAEYLVSLKAHYTERLREAGSNNWYEREVEKTDQVVTLAAPLILPPLAASRRSWFFSHLTFPSVQRRPAGSSGPYTDITATASINTLGPYPGTHLIQIVKSRAGSMWGFPVLPDGAAESQRLRRFKAKSLTQNSEIQVTPTGVSTSSPDDSVLLDSSATSVLTTSPMDPGASGDAGSLPQDSPPLPPEQAVRPPEDQALPPEPPARPPDPPVLPPAPPPQPVAPPVVPDAPPVLIPNTQPVFAGNTKPPGGFGDVPV